MKKVLGIIALIGFIAACSPKIGSEEWCNAMKEKPKGDWSSVEAKDYTEHCIF